MANKPNVRRGSGPVYYSWSPLPFQKGGNNKVQKSVKCDNQIDNVVTYVYQQLPNGDHLAYVYCDYVV
jgi:hypothetical protein